MLTRIAALVILTASAALAADLPTLPAVAASQPAARQEPFTPLVPLVTKTITDAERLVRAPMPKDATTMQADEELTKRKAALQKMADDLAGKNVTGSFTVLDVVPDGRENIVKVTGALAWKSKPILDEASEKKIKDLKNDYQEGMKHVSGDGVTLLKNAMQPKIDSAEISGKEKAEKRVPTHIVTIYMFNDSVKGWNKGQVKTVSGHVAKAELKPSTTDGITYVQSSFLIIPKSN